MLLFKSIIFSQNLIQNGSFENYTNIDCTYGGLDNGNPPYNHVVDNWYGYSSPDYYSSVCSSSGWFNVPNNIFGYSVASNGNNYVGCILFQKAGNMKEYIYQQLSAPLQSGKVYCLSFYVSRADRITHAIKSIGAYFSSSLPSLISGEYINAIPQVENQSGYITDTVQWTQIQGCFTANGGEQYITIGNFNSNSNTDTLFVGTNNQVFGADGYAYYYIDDIQLWDALTTDIESLDDSKFSVYPNPVNDVLNFEFTNEALNREVKLYDAIGNLVLTTELNQNKTSLNVSELPNGVYFYRILVEEKTIKTDKIVIIK